MPGYPSQRHRATAVLDMPWARWPRTPTVRPRPSHRRPGPRCPPAGRGRPWRGGPALGWGPALDPRETSHISPR
jgi:hypothetical protein